MTPGVIRTLGADVVGGLFFFDLPGEFQLALIAILPWPSCGNSFGLFGGFQIGLDRVAKLRPPC